MSSNRLGRALNPDERVGPAGAFQTNHLPYSLVVASDLRDPQFDALVCVTDKPERLCDLLGCDPCIGLFVEAYHKIDQSDDISVHVYDEIPSKRLVYVPTGPVTRDFDDVRRFQEAALKGIKRALAAGCRAPLVVAPNHEQYPLAERVTYLGYLVGIYTPLEVKEMVPEKSTKVDKIGMWLKDEKEVQILTVLERGRIVARDIGGSDPERMAAPKIADYVQDLFTGTCVKVKVMSDMGVLDKDYPLLAAVNRAASHVSRHGARLIELEYVGEGPIDKTLLLVGKGITYDTGGADIKAGGIMAGMHRDKCGAAAVAGFFQVLAAYKPKGLKVLGAMCCVRNSVGADSYVADEIIVSRAGVRVRIGNTDAEGRMVMADPLCQMKEKALSEINPLIFTLATLTGHVVRTYGKGYSAVMENGPARKAGVGNDLCEVGDMSGDPFEISTLRREDYEAHVGQNEYEDALQAYNVPSTPRRIDRGHQKPAAFLNLASGLDKHGNDSANPLPYCHVDIVGSAGFYPGIPTGAPLVALAHAYVINREAAN